MLFTSILVTLLPLLASATAAPLQSRAGGPAYIPIPDNCTIINPLPHASKHYGNGTVNGYQPSQNLLKSQIYSTYLSEPDYETLGDRWEGCLEQCNGFAGCKTALLAYNVPTPKGYYYTAGGVPSVACLFFNRTATPNDFVAATKGQYVNETAANIYCPS